MDKKILINVVDPEECRVAVLEDGVLEEFFVERAAGSRCRGNVYQGRVINVESGIQAAFVDIGGSTNGFLHASDCSPSVRRDDGPRSRPPPIQGFLRPGHEVLVQVTREGIGRKGPTLTTFVSLPGRYVVLMPELGRQGVSKKIVEESERRRLREILSRLEGPGTAGLILRTAAVGRSFEEIESDRAAIQETWDRMSKRARGIRAPALVHEETDLVTRTLRDILSDEIREIHVDSEDAIRRGRDFLEALGPDAVDVLRLHRGPAPLFHAFDVEGQIERIFSRRVPLPSGGHLVIEPTEALVAIDVNSGGLTAEKGLEETAVRTDLEAVPEICRQLRLRDLGGVVIIDFIDVREPSNRRRIERQLRECLERDRARLRIARLSEFCIVELTRQRVGPGIESMQRRPCSTCGGTGLIVTVESVTLKVLREIRRMIHDSPGHRIHVDLAPLVAEDLESRKRADLRKLEEESGCLVEIRPRTDHDLAVYRVRAAGIS